MWESHQDDLAAQQAQAADRAAAVVDAQTSDADLTVGHDAVLDVAQAASILADARSALQATATDARATLVATDGQVADDAVRQALSAQVAVADAALAAAPATSTDAASDGVPAPTSASASPTAAGYSAADLRAMTAALAAGNATVVAAHDAWTQAAAASAAAASAAAAPKTTAPKKAPSTGAAPSCGTTYSGPPFYTSPPTAGGDGSNGKLPPGELTAISWAKDPRGTPYYLRSVAAAALERLDQAFRAAFGHHLGLDLTYRDYDTQVAMRAALGTVAAVPGTSTHGTGLALDVPELPCEYGWDSPQRAWLVTHGPSYGWASPSWAGRGGSNPEYWHFEYVG